MNVDMSAALPDFMSDGIGRADLYAVQTAYAIDIMLTAVDRYMHGTYHLTRFALDALIFIHPQSPETEAVEDRIYGAYWAERTAEKSLYRNGKQYYSYEDGDFHVVMPTHECTEIAGSVCEDQGYARDQ